MTTPQQEKAQILANALLAIPMTQREREELALFTLCMTKQQIDEFIVLLQTQSTEATQTIADLKSQLESGVQ